MTTTKNTYTATSSTGEVFTEKTVRTVEFIIVAYWNNGTRSWASSSRRDLADKQASTWRGHKTLKPSVEVLPVTQLN